MAGQSPQQRLHDRLVDAQLRAASVMTELRSGTVTAELERVWFAEGPTAAYDMVYDIEWAAAYWERSQPSATLLDEPRLSLLDEPWQVLERLGRAFPHMGQRLDVETSIEDWRMYEEGNAEVLRLERTRTLVARSGLPRRGHGFRNPRRAPRRRGAGRPAARRVRAGSRAGPDDDPDEPPAPAAACLEAVAADVHLLSLLAFTPAEAVGA